MRTKGIIWTFLIMVGFYGQLLAQPNPINFTSLTTKDGLSSNSVNTIIKDRLGIVWIGTEDGLDRFDGLNFRVYRQKPGYSTSLQANEILALHEDKEGNLWVGTSGGSLSLYDRKRDAFINFPASRSPNSLDNNVILSICNDYQGNIWIGHYEGINILNPKTKTIKKLQSGNKIISLPGPCNVVIEDSRRNIWVGTNDGLFQFNQTTQKLQSFFHADQNPASLAHNHVNTVVEDKAGNIWIGTMNGLSLLKPGRSDFINYYQTGDPRKSVSSTVIESIAFNGDKLWLGTGAGLDIMDPQTGNIQTYRHDDRDNHSLNGSGVRHIYTDPQGVFWLGSFRGGVNKYDKNLNLFNYVQGNAFDQKGLNASIVTSFAENKDGKVFVGTDGPGLSLFDSKTRTFQHFNIKSRRNGADNRLSILAMQMSKRQKLLIGTYADGLFVFDPSSGSYQQLLQGPGVDDLNSGEIFSVYEDRQGNAWLGTNGNGINVVSPENKVIWRYTPNPKLPNDIRLPLNGYIRAIQEDKEGNFWIATHGGGIAVLQHATRRFTIYNTTNSSLPNDKVNSLAEDKRGNMWIGTKGGGLCVFNKKTKQFTVFSEKEGLQNTSVYKIVEDNNGLIWVSTNNGISSVNPETKKINNYNYYNGVQKNNFVQGSGLRLSNGELYFGGLEGFNYFNPAFLKKNDNIPVVLITDLIVSNQSVAPSKDGPITENISIAKKINLDYKQNFALRFVGLNYTAPEQNQYAYKLEGLDKDWNYVGNETVASYTNLDPGEYVFHVKASNNDGVWDTKGTSIKIYVHPPFWRTIYAYCLYALVVLGLLLYIRYRGIQKLKQKFALEQERVQREQERKEIERVHELDRLKIKFLTNLSHEFRTPISLILGPVDRLLQEQKNEGAARNLHLIKRNARRLLNLVNQLLDFRKMEENELRLQQTEGELVSFVKEVSDSFIDLSERKKIGFQFTSQIETLYTRFDHDKIERILFNVLSNAFKFTLEGGLIRLSLEKDTGRSDPERNWVAIKVIDNGIGIPADKKEKVFDRFFQNTTATEILNQGSGIGLSITKEFVKMHGGTIGVESEPGKGTTFTIHLPFTPIEKKQNAEEILPPAPAIAVEETLPSATAGKVEETGEQLTQPIELAVPAASSELPTILLVEDNDDFRFYIKDNLRLHYKVVEATNGKEGWQKALANHPQLIVSDISMPSMNGIELCKKIKTDKRTNHIPVILLTALTGEEDQIRGLETGANDYITKPFNFEVLNAKIKNLLVLNTTLKNTYSRQIKVVAPEVKVESEDEKLLQTISLYLEENLTNSQLSVEELSRHVGMSRSSLYSKLLEITGQTPVEYIRSVKLEKAAVLLEKSDMNVAQIAYSVGFATPNYFAKSFKAKYNMLPSEYMNKMRNKGEKENVDE